MFEPVAGAAYSRTVIHINILNIKYFTLFSLNSMSEIYIEYRTRITFSILINITN